MNKEESQKEYGIPVYDSDKNFVGDVKYLYNDDPDVWKDRRGNYKYITKLKDRFVLVSKSPSETDDNYGDIIRDDDAFVFLKSAGKDDLIRKYFNRVSRRDL